MADLRVTPKVEGSQPLDSPIADNPMAGGGRASSALPSAVSTDGDAVYQWLNRSGAAVSLIIPHLGLIGDPYSQANKDAIYTTAQTGVALWTPAGGKRLAITDFTITATGTTGGHVQLWFGASGDTTFTRGTDRAIYDGHLIPSASISPGISRGGLWIAGAADDVLRVTDDAAINELIVNVWGYEF